MSVLAHEPKVSRFPVAARRKVAAAMLTDLGWINGDIVLPKLNSLVDYLNNLDGYLKVTNVGLTGLEAPLNFLALNQDGYTLIVPKEDDERIESSRNQGPKEKQSRISCILKTGWVSGLLETSRMIRVSDFLTSANRFFALRDCTVTRGESRVHFPIVIVNGSRVIGISDPSLEQAKAGR